MWYNTLFYGRLPSFAWVFIRICDISTRKPSRSKRLFSLECLSRASEIRSIAKTATCVKKFDPRIPSRLIALIWLDGEKLNSTPSYPLTMVINHNLSPEQPKQLMWLQLRHVHDSDMKLTFFSPQVCMHKLRWIVATIYANTEHPLLKTNEVLIRFCNLLPFRSLKHMVKLKRFFPMFINTSVYLPLVIKRQPIPYFTAIILRSGAQQRRWQAIYRKSKSSCNKTETELMDLCGTDVMRVYCVGSLNSAEKPTYESIK